MDVSAFQQLISRVTGAFGGIEPGSAPASRLHAGNALVLYLLPQGAIPFSPAAATA